MRIKVYGSRGSAPVTGEEYREYGGNTSCFLTEGRDMVILDAGSGLLQLGQDLLRRFKEQAETPKRVHILLSHYHMDHIMGLGMCPLFQVHDLEIHIHGPAFEGFRCETVLQQIYSPPFWPVSLDELPARFIFHDIMPGPIYEIGQHIKFQAIESNHPDDCLAYLLEQTEEDGSSKKIGYMPDCECDETCRAAYADFYRACDLLIMDGTYLSDNFQKGWGHATWEEGIKLQKLAHIKKLLITHFGLSLTDKMLQEEEKKAQMQCKDCIFAREGMGIQI